MMKMKNIYILVTLLTFTFSFAQEKETTKDTITIEDNGKGMKYPQKIFERSYKENQIGHGIGMHIVHRLCSELNIKIKIKSIQNVGTTVELYIA